MKNSLITKLSVTAIMILLVPVLTINAQQLKDVDDNVYKTITHGKQVWTAVNLNVGHFRNGDAIPQAVSEEEWKNAAAAGTPAWCYYECDENNGKRFGKLYNWYAINDPRGLAPEGWHIPGNGDWNTLIKNLLGVDMAGSSLKNASGWKRRPGTNKIGFSAVPGGYRDPDGKFRELGQSCRLWSNSVPTEVKPSGQIYSIVLEDTSVEVKFLKADKGSGFSVRCEQD